MSEHSTTIDAISSSAVRWVTMPPSLAISLAPTARVTFITMGSAIGTEAMVSESAISRISSSFSPRKPTCTEAAAGCAERAGRGGVGRGGVGWGGVEEGATLLSVRTAAKRKQGLGEQRKSWSTVTAGESSRWVTLVSEQMADAAS